MFAKSKTYKAVWATEDNIFVIRRGYTSNAKIAANKEVIVQTYTFSRAQWELANSDAKHTLKDFFALDSTNCLDCPFSGNMGTGGCYTHKYMQYSGMLGMLRSIKIEDLTALTPEKEQFIIHMANGLYVRFGTYGEPSLIPLDLVSMMVTVSKSYTGYTHQHHKQWAQGYANFFMASTHATLKDGWRAFLVLEKGQDVDAIGCPASAEGGYRSNCSKCGLCSGTTGKGTKSVKIFNHA